MNEVPKWSMPTLAYHEACQDIIGNSPTAEEPSKEFRNFAKCFRTAYIRRLGALLRKAGETSRGYDNDPFGDWGASVTSFSARYDWSSIRVFMRALDPRTGDRLHARENGMARKK